MNQIRVMIECPLIFQPLEFISNSDYIGENTMIFATPLHGTPYKFCHSPGMNTGVWIDYLSREPNTKVLTLYFSTERNGFVIASGGPNGWSDELFVNIDINKFESFTLTFQEKSAIFNFSTGVVHEYNFESNLTCSHIRYLRWGQGIIPPLSLVPSESTAAHPNQGSASDDAQEDLPVEYFVLSARLKRLEDACLKAGIVVS